MSEVAFEAGTLLAQRYRVESVLGTGGMGRVYRARDEALGRPVALKVLHAGMVAQAARFEREARTGAALTHPAVVRVLAYGVLEDTRPYLALEFVEGENLAVVLRRDGPMDSRRAVRLLLPVAGALSEAHARGIIHRDLKPENLLLSRNAGMDETLRLLDFGIAGLKVVDSEEPVERLTMTGQVFGTPEYMAPEQAMGRATTPATDVWAFGAVLHAFLRGRGPFEGAHIPEILFRVVNGAPAALPEGTPADMCALVAQCLQKRPEDRPADARTLLQALEALASTPLATVALALSPVTAPPVATGPSLGPAPRNLRALAPHAGPMAAAAAAAVVLGFGLGRLGHDTVDRPPVETGAAGSAPGSAALPAPTPGAREQALSLLTSGRIAEAVPAVKSLLQAAPETAHDAAFVDALLSGFERKEGGPLADAIDGDVVASARDRLLTDAGSPDPWLRWRAVNCIAAASPQGPDAKAARIAALRQDLRMEDCDVRRRTIVELGDMGDATLIPDVRAARSRFNFISNLCLGNVDDVAIAKLKRGKAP